MATSDLKKTVPLKDNYSLQMLLRNPSTTLIPSPLTKVMKGSRDLKREVFQRN